MADARHTGESERPIGPELFSEAAKKLPHRQDLESRIIRRAWTDDAFRRELLHDPKAVASRELGMTIPKGVHIEVHQETSDTLHLVLPMNPVPQARQVSDDELETELAARPCWTSGFQWFGSCYDQ